MIKSLIIFDTNKLRATKDGSVSYGNFNFSSEFSMLKSKIIEKGLKDYIAIAIPEISLKELIQQKVESFNEDNSSLRQILNRLSQIPDLVVPSFNFTISEAEIKSRLEEDLSKTLKKIDCVIIKLPEDKLHLIMKRITKRAIERIQPFYKNRGSKDTGFKDNLIWETILNFKEISNYDKIYFLTEDNDFYGKECKTEFENEFLKGIEIYNSVNYLESEIDGIYNKEIENFKWKKYANEDYFISYLKNQLSTLEEIDYNGKSYKVIEKEIKSYFFDIEPYIDLDNEDEDMVILSSLIRSKLENEGKFEGRNIIGKTIIDDSKEIRGTQWELHNYE
jgi:hypothetical protein